MLRSSKYRTVLAVAATAVAAGGLGLFAVTAADAHTGGHPARKPTVVLVHGAFADSSGFNAVTRRLLADGYPVVAAPNPLRGISSDAAPMSSPCARASASGPGTPSLKQSQPAGGIRYADVLRLSVYRIFDSYLLMA